jgi:hypothetical protein
VVKAKKEAPDPRDADPANEQTIAIICDVIPNDIVAAA